MNGATATTLHVTSMSSDQRPPYPRYKASGVEWLGDVPEHWAVVRSDNMVATSKRQIPPDAFAGRDVFHYSIPAVQELGTGAVENGDDIESAKQLVDEPVVLVSRLNPRKATICRAESHGHLLTLASTEFVALRPKTGDIRFLEYAVSSELFRQRLDSRVQSVTRSHQRARPEDIYRFWGAWPDLHEQRAIATFLDRESARIDALVVKEHELIERLREKRQALISRTVTKGLQPAAALAAGLNPSPKTRSSGIDWLGDVPEHWESGILRRFATMRTGHTPSRSEPQYWEDCDIPWFTLADVWQLRDGKRVYLGDTKEKISQLGLANSAAELLPAGTVIFSRTASIGFSGIMPVPMATTQDFWNWIPGPRLVPEYLLYLFRAMNQVFEALTMGSTHKTIYQPDAARLAVCVPPRDEQLRIIEYLSVETSHIDSLTEQTELAIERLLEYRTALITAAVTGKIDVRGIAA